MCNINLAFVCSQDCTNIVFFAADFGMLYTPDLKYFATGTIVEIFFRSKI